MAPELDDAAVVDHGYAIGPHRRGQPVGDDDRGAALEENVKGALDALWQPVGIPRLPLGAASPEAVQGGKEALASVRDLA